MRLIYTNGFGEQERKEIRQVIFSNMVVAFKIIREEMIDMGLKYEKTETEVRMRPISRIDCCSMETGSRIAHQRG